LQSLVGLNSPVECVAFDPSENKVAAGAANGTVKVWDLETGKGERLPGAEHDGSIRQQLHQPAAPHMHSRLAAAQLLASFSAFP
jgi:hypothetical protein